MKYNESRRVNPFLHYLENKNLEVHDLKLLYRELLKKTHPDTAGSEKYLKEFLNLKEDYEEALYIINKGSPREIPLRYKFFLILNELENLELPANRNKKNKIVIVQKEQLLRKCDISWLNGIDCETYRKALDEYSRIRRKKPYNDLHHLRKPVFYEILRPWLHNLCHYHLTGKSYFINTLERSWLKIIPSFTDNSRERIKLEFSDFLKALYKDYKKGPALND
jgi:hypothetical protein